VSISITVQATPTLGANTFTGTQTMPGLAVSTTGDPAPSQNNGNSTAAQRANSYQFRFESTVRAQITATRASGSATQTRLAIAVTPSGGSLTEAFALESDSRAVFTGSVKTLSTTVGALPAAATAGAGARAFVTDANSATFGDAAVGGGANAMPVWCNGTGWFIG
jgi:hypothetical protein